MIVVDSWLISAFVGGVVFNLSNILLVGAIDIAGMAVACIVVAIVLDALAYRRLASAQRRTAQDRLDFRRDVCILCIGTRNPHCFQGLNR